MGVFSLFDNLSCTSLLRHVCVFDLQKKIKHLICSIYVKVNVNHQL